MTSPQTHPISTKNIDIEMTIHDVINDFLVQTTIFFNSANDLNCIA